jgi:hypothetical protein
LVRIARKMMAKDPADRFQSADEVSRALAEFNPAARELKRAVPLEAAAPADPLSELDFSSARGVGVSGAHRTLGTGAKKGGLSQQQTMFVVAGVFGVVLLAVVGLIALLATSKRPPPPSPAVHRQRDEDSEQTRRDWGKKFETPVTGGFDPSKAVTEEEMTAKRRAAEAAKAAKPAASAAKPAATDGKKVEKPAATKASETSKPK